MRTNQYDKKDHNLLNPMELDIYIYINDLRLPEYLFLC